MPSTLNVKQVRNGFQIELYGDDELVKVSPQKIEHFIHSRLACAARNRCSAKERSIAERMDCVQKLADRRIAKVGQASLTDQQIQVTTKKVAKGLQISVTGPQLEKFKESFQPSAIEEGLKAIRACRQANGCGTREQSLAQRWQCVSTLGARRFTDI